MYLDYALKVSTDIFVSMKLWKPPYKLPNFKLGYEFITSELLNLIIHDKHPMFRSVFIPLL